MNIFELARRPSRRIRAALVILALAFSLDVVAHANVHVKDFTSGTHAVLCDYCAAFSGVADGPEYSAVVRTPVPEDLPIVLPALSRKSLQPETSAHPRAPPVR